MPVNFVKSKECQVTLKDFNSTIYLLLNACRAVAGINWGEGAYLYMHVLHNSFLLKLINFDQRNLSG